MASERYRVYKFIYTHDNGEDVVRQQREYYNQLTSLIPITQLFLDRVITDPVKVVPKKSDQLRHVISYVENDQTQNGFSEYISFIPYRPGDVSFNDHLNEILNVQFVQCGDYKGEVKHYAK